MVVFIRGLDVLAKIEAGGGGGMGGTINVHPLKGRKVLSCLQVGSAKSVRPTIFPV